MGRQRDAQQFSDEVLCLPPPPAARGAACAQTGRVKHTCVQETKRFIVWSVTGLFAVMGRAMLSLEEYMEKLITDDTRATLPREARFENVSR